jgi:hypothetical protein
MDDARAVLARLDRIETLEREGAPPASCSKNCAGSSKKRRPGHGEKEVSERRTQSNVAHRL